jgi:hypothetical protein
MNLATLSLIATSDSVDALCRAGITSSANRRLELVLAATKENFYSSLCAIAAAIRAGDLPKRIVWTTRT